MAHGRMTQHALARVPTVPEGEDLAGNYDRTALQAALTPAQQRSLAAFMDDQTVPLTHGGRPVLFWHDVQRWARDLPAWD